TVGGTGTSAAMKLWPKVVVSKGGEESASDGSNTGETVKLKAYYEKGTYSITVGDIDANHVGKLTGGAGFTLDIQEITGAEADELAKAAGKGGDKEKAEKKDEESDEKADEKKDEKPAATATAKATATGK